MRKARETIAPDLTPVIDIVFILLIFFMVTSVFKKEDVALALNLPELHAAAKPTDKKTVTIELGEDALAVDGKTYTFEETGTLFAGYEKETLLSVRIDKSVPYERIMKLFDQLQTHQLTSFSLIANEAEEQK
ncbi:MAG: biopolymer transporter ExbD [Campylobacterota bacterium]|nr:biopolymer transporter ExbD [Campylobacterota bacterium]